MTVAVVHSSAALSPAQSEDLFALTGVREALVLHLSGQPDQPGSRFLLDLAPTDRFETLVVLPTQRYFAGRWGRRFLRFVARAVAPGGVLWLPAAKPAGRSPALFVSDDDLAAWLPEARPMAAPKAWRALHFPEGLVGAQPGEDTGTLDWFHRQYRDPVLTQALSVSPAQLDLQALSALVARSQGEVDTAFPEDYLRVSDAGARSDAGQDVSLMRQRTVAYWAGGVAYKSAAIETILDSFGLHRVQDWIDFGGGMGQVGAELLLGTPDIVGRCTTVELSAGNAWWSDALLARHRQTLQGRFRFVAGSMARWWPEQAPDLVTCFGALLYLERHQAAAALQRWWAGLRPGGLLVLHENLRSEQTPPSRDRTHMFWPQELEQLSAFMGTPRLFGTTQMGEIDWAAGREKSVFRVWRKPAA